MFGTHFYNEGLRKLTIAFGQLFNNIIIQNTSSTGAYKLKEQAQIVQYNLLECL